uniref:Testis expressed 36 n=1 Tax=Gallus gallus TaxID=9031 RepID=A0A8V0X5S8_CHICK
MRMTSNSKQVMKIHAFSYCFFFFFQCAVNNNFPFSSHDNRHCLQNVGEYFDFGLGRRKVEPQRRQQNSQNFFEWASESVKRSEDGLTIYQTSFVKDKSPFSRQYPKHFSEKSCTDKAPRQKEKKVRLKVEVSEMLSLRWAGSEKGLMVL